jgi:hypothetical protein
MTMPNDSSPARARAGRINALRRWNPDSPEIRAASVEDIAAACRAQVERYGPIATHEAAQILAALALDPGVVCRRVEHDRAEIMHAMAEQTWPPKS